MKRLEWEKNIDSEIRFWNDWLLSRGLEWKDDYNYRMNPLSEVNGFFKSVLETKNVNKDYSILDVGAGPITILGKYYNGIKLNITAVDALAKFYDKLNWLDNRPEIITQYCETEELDNTFANDMFDMVYARNTLDHHYDAPLAIKKMMQVAKIGGTIVLSHSENEATKHNWHGLHKWNFSIYNNDMKIVSQQNEVLLSNIISPHGKIILIEKDKENIINVVIEKF
jgi:ubiquinone/menaquinone biosynthesis C-methylase UbiE